MSEKKCTHHKDRRKKIIRRTCTGILIFLFIVLLIVLIIWAILQPKKPRFILQDATIFNFNLSGTPNIFSTTIQVTVISRNPNDNIGIYYDRLDAFAAYRGQQITVFTTIPPVYQGHKDANVWSPFLYGNNVPIAPFNGLMLQQDQTNGAVWLHIKIDGRVKWKVGTVITGRYHLHVTCPAYIPFGNTPRTGGIVVGNAVKYQLDRSCDVSV